MARALDRGVERFTRAAMGTWSRVIATGSSYAFLPLRLGFGLIFFAHGAQKVFGLFGGPGLGQASEGFEAMGFAPGLLFALLAGLLELVGGICLAFGLLARIAGVLLALEMVIAALRVHWQNGFFLNWANTPGVGHGIEYSLALIVGLLGPVIYGAGALSIDRLIVVSHRRRTLSGKPPAAPSGS
jgi:putative oxidoreductase